MSTLGNIFVLLGLVGSVWGIIRLLRQRKHPLTKRLNLIMLIGGIILAIVGSPMANTKAASGSPHQSSSVSKTKALTAKQQSRLDAEKAHGKILLAVKAKKVAELKALKKEEASLESEASSQAAASSVAAASSSRAASEAASKEASASQVAASEQAAAASSQAAAATQAAKQAEEAQKSAANQQATQPQQQAPAKSGDLYTGNQGTIIGNSRSKIYHVPGQAGYHMNSANAVYFNSEADAQAAGYRKALR
ncbi:sunset domain-containing protein [Lacticaseibacillus paracasei]|uniref:sunset domain-containing protein n=1 Tax=Lacticaseibacillus paracasei TaxID=1597 RepID=UPI0021A9317C|nr:DNA-entry nuclease [Lacticaseibacillus paracasei]MCT2893529.1 DNA-entry nuclease [Lacticaseibacillus paracasei]